MKVPFFPVLAVALLSSAARYHPIYVDQRGAFVLRKLARARSDGAFVLALAPKPDDPHDWVFAAVREIGSGLRSLPGGKAPPLGPAREGIAE